MSLTVLCYYPVSFCVEEAVAVVTHPLFPPRPLCEHHLENYYECLVGLPTELFDDFRLSKVFIPAIEPTPNCRLGD